MAEVDIQQEVKTAFGALQEELKKDIPSPEVMEKINVTLGAQEVKNQELVAELKTREGEQRELKEQIEALEGEVSRGTKTGTGQSHKEMPEYKTLQLALCKGDRELDVEQKQLLRTDSDPSGGFLVPEEMDNQITKGITEISPVRSVARVRTIAGKTLNIPVRNRILEAEYEGEAETSTDDTSTYKNETLTPFRLAVTVPITADLLMDAAFDMEAEIFQDASESFAQKEGRKFIIGSSVKEPSGFIADLRVQAGARNASGGSTYTGDDLILLTGDLKTGYNPIYMLNRRELAFIRTLKGSDGHYLWQPGLNGVVANTLNGFNYSIAEDMPDKATDAFPIAFGDFFRGYTIVDRTGTRIIRDEVTRKKQAIVEFEVMRWNTGQVTLPEAIKLLKTVT